METRTFMLQQYLPFTVLKRFDFGRYASLYLWLQQYLPFTVLKHEQSLRMHVFSFRLQQYLPFTVLKLIYEFHNYSPLPVATVPTVYGIETFHLKMPLYRQYTQL